MESVDWLLEDTFHGSCDKEDRDWLLEVVVSVALLAPAERKRGFQYSWNGKCGLNVEKIPLNIGKIPSNIRKR